MTKMTVEKCKTCNGVGVVGDNTCHDCDGSGYTGTQWNERLNFHTVSLRDYIALLADKSDLQAELDQFEDVDLDEYEGFQSAKENRMAMYDR